MRVQRDRADITTKAAVENLGRDAWIYEAELSASESVAALIPSVLEDGHRIDILLNSAGIQKRHPSHQFPTDDWNEVYMSAI